jgi:hypothetical protein
LAPRGTPHEGKQFLINLSKNVKELYIYDVLTYLNPPLREGTHSIIGLGPKDGKTRF